MNKNRFITGSLVLLTGAMLALPTQPARAQRRTVQPERRLLGISLGASFMDVIRRYGQPSEIQTVALSNEGDALPGLAAGGGGAGGSAAMAGGFPGMMSGGMMPGGQMGGAGMRGGGGGMMPGAQMGGAGMGGMYSGMMGGGGGGGMMPGAQMGGAGMRGGGGPGMRGGAGMSIPSLPPVGGGGMMPGAQMGGPGMRGGAGGMMPGAQMGGMMPGGQMGGAGMRGGMGMRGRGMDDDGMGMGGGMAGGLGMGGGASADANMPEYSTATLWIYKRPSDIRLEFLINEDGRVAQISAAAPAVSSAKAAAIAGARTSRGVTLGTPFSRVTNSYGYPERFRMLPGLRFYETYFTKNYHAAFTFDTLKNMKCVRITIALAD